MTDWRQPEELTPDERARWEALPTGRMPPPELEERVVRALRHERLLRPGKPRWPRNAAGIAASIAAAVMIFAAGLVVGSGLAPGRITPVNGADPVLQLQQAGSAYVHALSRLERSAGAAPDTASITQVALSTFEGAAREITRLTSATPASAPAPDRSVIWF